MIFSAAANISPRRFTFRGRLVPAFIRDTSYRFVGLLPRMETG
jgi:hypothetical protein